MGLKAREVGRRNGDAFPSTAVIARYTRWQAISPRRHILKECKPGMQLEARRWSIAARRDGQSIRATLETYDVANGVHLLGEDSRSGTWTYPSCCGCRTKDNKWSRRDPTRAFEKMGPGCAFELHATLNHVGPRASPIQIPALKQMLHAWVISSPVNSYWILSRKIQIQRPSCSGPIAASTNGDAFHILYHISE